MQIEDLMERSISRRTALKAGGALALASQAMFIDRLAFTPVRPAFAAPAFSDIQFDVGAFVRPAQTFNDGVNDILYSRRPFSDYDQLVKDWQKAAGDAVRQEYMEAMSAA